MFSRFAAAVVLIVVTVLVGIALEKRNLELRRSLSLQAYRIEQLEERLARVKLELEQLRSIKTADQAGKKN